MASIGTILAERRAFVGVGGWWRAQWNRVLRRLGQKSGRTWVLRVRGLAEPIAVRAGSTDMGVVLELFHLGEYDAVRRLVGPGTRLIVDLGANIGLSVRLWLEAAPKAVIVAVEPDAGNVAMLRRNVAMSGEGSRVRVIEAGVGGAEGWATLDRSGGEWAFRVGSVREGNEDRPAGEAIRVLTLPRILEEAGVAEFGGGIDLLKCDIEGAEEGVFGSCEAWIGRVGAAVIETHGSYSPERLRRDLEVGEAAGGHRGGPGGGGGDGAGLVGRVLRSLGDQHVLLFTRGGSGADGNRT